jgi:SAM-dependent methyltransferase
VRIDPLELTPLPIEDNSVDMLLLNGVLEWVGAGVEEGCPRDHQLALLEDVVRVLKPEGTLYLAIESRWGLSMLLGGEDHPKTRFTSVVPRWLASILTRRAGKGPYRTWTYGYRALRGLLHDAGLTRTEFSSPFPDYRFPHSIVPIEDRSTFRQNIFRPGLTHGHARLLSLAAIFGLHKDAVSHYSVIARP